MTAGHDLSGPGTPEAEWASGLPSGLERAGVDRFVPSSGRVVVVAPHPDDEVLGSGGLLFELGRADVAVTIVAVTDGEASHPGRASELRAIRAAERATALAQLGFGPGDVVRLGHPDGAVEARAVAADLDSIIGPDDVVITPSSDDGHPDHDACGHAAALCASRPLLWSYLVWTWHWSRPAEVPWDLADRLDLSPEALQAKRTATQAFRSQLAGPVPILPDHVLERLLRPYEIYLRQPDPPEDSG